MGAQWSQVFPPKPNFTEVSLEPQDGKVFLVTGGYSGIGFELATTLYQNHGRVYVAGRSEEKALQAIRDIRLKIPISRGHLEFLHLELDDLSSIKASVEAFKEKESKLHVLWSLEQCSRVAATLGERFEAEHRAPASDQLSRSVPVHAAADAPDRGDRCYSATWFRPCHLGQQPKRLSLGPSRRHCPVGPPLAPEGPNPQLYQFQDRGLVPRHPACQGAEECPRLGGYRQRGFEPGNRVHEPLPAHAAPLLCGLAADVQAQDGGVYGALRWLVG